MTLEGDREQDPELLRGKLNSETARIAWRDLQRHFAAGSVIGVAPELNLLDVGEAIARDDKARVEAWMNDGRVGPVSDAQAAEWYEVNAAMWSVVVRPWVLVQPILADDDRA